MEFKELSIEKITSVLAKIIEMRNQCEIEYQIEKRK